MEVFMIGGGGNGFQSGANFTTNSGGGTAYGGGIGGYGIAGIATAGTNGTGGGGGGDNNIGKSGGSGVLIISF